MIETKAMKLAGAVLLAAVLALPGGAAWAQRAPDTCLGNVLRLPSVEGADLKVSVPCTVNAGTYKFGNVNIIAGGELKFSDAEIDFWAESILVENGGTLSAGTPENPIGKAGGRLTIHLWGKDQTGTDPSKQGQGITCLSTTPTDPCGIPAALWNSNIGAGGMPVPPAQARRISEVPGLPAYPPGRTDDYFYAYGPLPFDGAPDPITQRVGYFGYKVLGVSYGGSLQLYGKKGATYAAPECGAAPTTSGTSWARLNATAGAGTSQLTVDRPLSLKAGDQIVVTTTDYLPGHSEQRTVKTDVTCGTTIDVTENLKYTHSGTRFPLTAVPDTVGLDAQLRAAGAETRAAVGVLTRSIRIVSEGDDVGSEFPAEATGYSFGGHVIARQGFKTFQMQGVELYQMGQGGRIGHYPIHFHMARKTAPGTFVRDSSIHDSMTRWIVLHGTHDVVLERNVGYKSIGHGFYLEDGTEINNTLTANLGVFARAAIDNVQNPRKVPGILAAPDLTPARNPDGVKLPVGENVPFQSDYDHPAVFWVMNGWNDFKDNMAAGAGMCGVCYWFVPGFNSTMSREQRWASYASLQDTDDRAGTTPLKSFVGNSCTSAMTSFQTVLKTAACFGLGPPDTGVYPFPVVEPLSNPLAPVSTSAAAAGYYPNVVDAGHKPTQCGTGLPDDATDCAKDAVPPQPVCSAGTPGACKPTILDHYTTSFNWAAFNFAAIWLRPLWYLVTDSVITDVQGAGLSMVTGGGYDASSVIPGQWALVRKSVFIGNTQQDNPLASNGGPFNHLASPAYPNGLRCAVNVNHDRPGSYCLSIAEGVSLPVENFGMYQRLFSLYDGPALQESNAYLNIKTREIDDCTPFTAPPTDPPSGRCAPKPIIAPNNQSTWTAGFVNGLPKTNGKCYMPNAAVGWKQPNGFYYPPANHSANLFFDGVDIRHFVVSPLFKEGTLEPDVDNIKLDYCNWSPRVFDGFAGNDRQTVLNDDDGTLTGYVKTTAINLDDFFNAPVDALQCRSDATSRTSPYEYVTSVVYPECAVSGSCAKTSNPPGAKPWADQNYNSGDWNRACTNQSCYGVPLYRQDKMPLADGGIARSIRMMGQEIGQRSSLTINHGTYYVDTTVGLDRQQTDCPKSDPALTHCAVNVFKASSSYYLFLIYAKESTEQTYRFYVGESVAPDYPASINLVQADIRTVPVNFSDPIGKPRIARWLNGDQATAKGVVEVVFGPSDIADLATQIKNARKAKCQPATYCKWDAAGNNNLGACNDVFPRPGEAPDAVCRWAIADLDCPEKGCVGIEFTLPDGFTTNPAQDPRPAAACVANAPPWNVPLTNAGNGGMCPVEADKLPPDFCAP